MNIAIIGVGYVGLVTGACFAELGANVYCVDVDEKKIDQLKRGEIPIYEARLQPMVQSNSKAQRLHFTSRLEEVINEVEMVFIAVGTPPEEDGSADLSHVIAVARTIGRLMQKYLLVVTKSTVPVGTSEEVRRAIRAEQELRGVDIPFDIASNPEFLKEGNAVDDFMKPDRVVVGVDSQKAQRLMTQLYKPMLLNNFRVLFMDIPSAEMTKYASNAMLATRISFINEIANLCEKVGADIQQVRIGIGSDERIGSKFLYPGCGYGGSCFPKDVKALIATAHEVDVDMPLLESVEKVNYKQKEILFDKFCAFYNGDISGRQVAVWGLSFKPGTNDMREAPSIVLIQKLLEHNCKVRVFDPVAMPEARLLFGDSVEYAQDPYQAVVDAVALFHVTEWKQYRMPHWDTLARLMANPLLIDGRNVFDLGEDSPFTYLSIGRGKENGSRS